jgi:histidine triad (HIT) family protein
MKDCIFCKIIAGEIPVKTKVFEDDKVFAFEDINPQAPVHILIVPKKHISCLNEANSENLELLGYIQLVASQIAKQKGLEGGYRLVNNCGADAGQTVFHIHYHLLGGRVFAWPPG